MKHSLQEQKTVILRVLRTGTPEEVRTLEEARQDPKVHPAVHKLIDACRLEVIRQIGGSSHWGEYHVLPRGSFGAVHR